MVSETLYLFDGSNLAHTGGYDDRDTLADVLASFVASRGARGVLVFDGVGRERRIGALEVRFAADADELLERLAADHRRDETVVLVTSDATVRATSGLDVRSVLSAAFLDELDSAKHREEAPSRVRDRIDDDTRARLERLRRGQA